MDTEVIIVEFYRLRELKVDLLQVEGYLSQYLNKVCFAKQKNYNYEP